MSLENIEILKKGLASYGLNPTDEMIDRFVKYREILVEYNKVMNLTAITEEREVFIKHFLDSASIFEKNYIQSGQKIIDVGTGAGFPGIPFKICNPNIELTLLDSLNKRINFLREVCQSIGFNDVEYVHARAEDGAQNKNYREKFDIATARAVANLPVLLELCIPFVKKGGLFICLKGPNAKKEIEDAKNAIKILGVELLEILDVKLPDEELHHNILVFKKLENTDKKYPRKAGTPNRKPL